MILLNSAEAKKRHEQTTTAVNRIKKSESQASINSNHEENPAHDNVKGMAEKAPRYYSTIGLLSSLNRQGQYIPRSDTVAV